MTWVDIAKVVAPIIIAITGFLAYFLRKPASLIDESTANKMAAETEILRNNIREESIDLLKDMITTQTELINTLRVEVQDLRSEITDIRKEYDEIWEDNNNLRKELKILRGGL